MTTLSSLPADFNELLGNTQAVESLRTAIAAGRNAEWPKSDHPVEIFFATVAHVPGPAQPRRDVRPFVPYSREKLHCGHTKIAMKRKL